MVLQNNPKQKTGNEADLFSNYTHKKASFKLEQVVKP